MKYKKHIATGALAISLLVGGSAAFASGPHDLGIKDTQPTYQRHMKGMKNMPKIRKNRVVGVITALNDTGFSLEVKGKRLNNIFTIDVKLDDNTIFTENGILVTKDKLAVGQKVLVFGPLDKTTKILTAKKVKIVTMNPVN